MASYGRIGLALADGSVAPAALSTAARTKLLVSASLNQAFAVALGYPVGSATAGVGFIPKRAVHLTRLSGTVNAITATVSTAVEVTITVYKNANSGTTNRCFVATLSGVASATGYNFNTTTVVDAGMDAFNGTTDYLTIGVAVTASTSLTTAPTTIYIECTDD